MAKLVTGTVVLKSTVAQIRDASVSQKKSRGPKQIGQLKSQVVVHLGVISQEELAERLEIAGAVLSTGGYASKKTSSPKAEKGTAVADLKKAEKEIRALEEINMSLTDELLEKGTLINALGGRVKEFEAKESTANEMVKPPPFYDSPNEKLDVTLTGNPGIGTAKSKAAVKPPKTTDED